MKSRLVVMMFAVNGASMSVGVVAVCVDVVGEHFLNICLRLLILEWQYIIMAALYKWSQELMLMFFFAPNVNKRRMIVT